MNHARPRRLLGGKPPAGSSGPTALRPRFALPPGIPQGFRFAAPLALRAHPHIEAPKGGRMVPPGAAPSPRPKAARIGTPPPQGLQERPGHRLRSQQAALVRYPLPSPPPLPAGKGSESPSVVKGAGGRPAALKPPTPLTRASIVPAASRVRFTCILTRSVLGLRPALRVRPPVQPLTRLPLKNRTPAALAGAANHHSFQKTENKAR